jgi:hypothetical protein
MPLPLPFPLSNDKIATESAQRLLRRCQPTYQGRHPIVLDTNAIGSAIPRFILEVACIVPGSPICFSNELCGAIKKEITSALETLNETLNAKLDNEYILRKLTDFLKRHAPEQAYTQWIISELTGQCYRFARGASFTEENITNLITEVNKRLPLFIEANTIRDLRKKIIESLVPTEDEFFSAEENEAGFESSTPSHSSAIDKGLPIIIEALEKLARSATDESLTVVSPSFSQSLLP